MVLVLASPAFMVLTYSSQHYSGEWCDMHMRQCWGFNLRPPAYRQMLYHGAISSFLVCKFIKLPPNKAENKEAQLSSRRFYESCVYSWYEVKETVGVSS